MILRWAWDPDKNEYNRRTHGITFENAVRVFDDPFAATREDPYPFEQRWRTMGQVDSLIIQVIHTLPGNYATNGDAVGRIISARKATRRERNAYEQGTF